MAEKELFNDNQYKKFGDEVEDLMLLKIQEKEPDAYNANINGVKNSDWDIKNSKELINSFGIEIKADYESVISRNIIIEVSRIDTGEYTGLSVTKAKYWNIVTGHHIIQISPFEIYRFIEKGGRTTHPDWILYDLKREESKKYSHYGRVPMQGDGDGYTKLVYKLNYDDFLEYVNNLNNEECFVLEIDKDDALHFDKMNAKWHFKYMWND
jgi:hypothetical protein